MGLCSPMESAITTAGSPSPTPPSATPATMSVRLCCAVAVCPLSPGEPTSRCWVSQGKCQGSSAVGEGRSGQRSEQCGQMPSPQWLDIKAKSLSSCLLVLPLQSRLSLSKSLRDISQQRWRRWWTSPVEPKVTQRCGDKGPRPSASLMPVKTSLSPTSLSRPHH